MKKVLILGAGVSGLTTALHLLNSGFEVTLWSKESQDSFPITSINAYAMWVPVKIDADPRIERWTNETLGVLSNLSTNAATGIRLIDIVQLKVERSEPWFASSFAGFRHALSNEISADYADAHVLQLAPVIDPTIYLPWLRQQVLAAGGKFAQKEVTNVADCADEFGIIVNCTGIGARILVPDADVFADRVQVVTIASKPGIDKIVIDDEGPHKRACVVPHGSYIKLGGFFDGDKDGCEIDDAATQDILDRCNRMVPGLNATFADVIEVNRASRPERKGWLPRVESETMADGRVIVHNYGHDGMGYILSHGIAADIVGMLVVPEENVAVK